MKDKSKEPRQQTFYLPARTHLLAEKNLQHSAVRRNHRWLHAPASSALCAHKTDLSSRSPPQKLLLYGATMPSTGPASPGLKLHDPAALYLRTSFVSERTVRSNHLTPPPATHS